MAPPNCCRTTRRSGAGERIDVARDTHSRRLGAEGD
jgi:hypothetical protein